MALATALLFPLAAGAQSAADLLDSAEEAFLDVEYELALATLERVEQSRGASDEQLERVLALRGTILFVQGLEGQAADSYRRLIGMNRAHRLPDFHPPRAVAFLDRIRQEAGVEVEIDHRSPSSFGAGDPFEISANIPGVGAGTTVRVFYRAEGDRNYASSEMNNEGDDQYVGVIPGVEQLGEATRVVEYFIMVARGEDRVANEGSPRAPMSFAVLDTGTSRPPTTRSRSRWWIWAIIGGAVAVGLGLGLGLGLQGEDEEPTGSATISLGFE